MGAPGLLSLAFLSTAVASAQVAITPNVPTYGFQVLAGSTRQINVNITGGTLNKVNWSVLSTKGGASATFTTPNGADVSSVGGALPTVQVNIGPTQGNCSISGSGPYTISSTASVTVQAQSVDDLTKTTSFLFNVCANSPAVLANGTSSVIVAPVYQQAYQNQPMTLQSWIVGCTDETGTWSIVKEPSGGNGTLVDTNNRDTVFSASVTGRYTIQYTANCNSGTNTAIVYVSPNPLPSYAATPNGTRPHECYVDPELTGADYEVGPGKAYTSISSTPALTGFKPGTIMRIWNTDTTGTNPSTYYEYYNIQNSGTPTQPIIVCGVADSNGNLPIMDGTNAHAQSDVDIAAGDGMIILWPGSSHYGYWQGGSAGPSYVSVTGLHLRNANSTLSRYSPGAGSATAWQNFTGCINDRSGAYVDISGNDLDNCSLGIFTDDNANNAWATITQNFTFIGNHIHLSGDPAYVGSTHQTYLQTYYALAEGNRLDNPTAYVGAAFKWRGVEGIFRYNYIGDGTSRLTDFVENQDGPAYMTFEQYLGGNFGLYGYGDTAGANVIAAYQESSQKDFVYGNVMLGRSAQENLHYGGDQGSPGMSVRNGTLYVYSNTLDNAQMIFDNGDNDGYDDGYYQARIDARNNIFWARTVSWSGVVQMEFNKYSSIILNAATNLMQAGTFSIQTPINGANWSDGTNNGWSNQCDGGTCPWPLTLPIDPHLYGLSAANYLATTTQPYNGTTFIPPNGSAAIGAGTSLSGTTLQEMPVRWQFNVSSNSLTPRRDPLTIGAEDPASGSSSSVAATPTFNPGSGTYSSKQTITISTTTPGATIYYTTDGSTPTTGSQSYSGPITISSSETVSAIAVASGYTNSVVGSASYVITQGQVATPTFSPAAGTYTLAQTVTISDTTAGATIYYTTNGTTPTTSSAVYSAPITVSSTETIEAIAAVSGYTNSAVATAAYTINQAQAATPTFSPAPGTYSSSQTVSISDSTSGAKIYYTTNGTAPSASSAVYSGPITVTSSETIAAIAVANGYSNSAVASATYSINLAISQAAAPAFTPSGGSYTSAQSVTINTTTPSATIYYTTNGSAPTVGSAVYSGAITVSTSETIQAIAVASGLSNSPIANATYTINTPISQAAAPIFTPNSGSYTSAQTVNLSSSTPSATIYYTTDGSTPTTSSAVYSGPITVASTETLKAIAAASGYSNSAVAAAAYSINIPSGDFSFSASPTSLTITDSQNGKTSLSVLPLNGFQSNIAFSCSGLPTGISCNFSPGNITPSGAPASTMLTMAMTANTSGTSAANHMPTPVFPGTALAVILCFFSRKNRRRLQTILLLIISIASLYVMNGCGGASLVNNGTASKTVTTPVTITATSGTLQHTITVSVSVN